MGTFLSIMLYSAYIFFLGRISWRAFLLLTAQEQVRDRSGGAAGKKDRLSLLRAAIDILFLSRLFRTNRWLWLGECVFHATFVFVLVRHLRYVMQPPPAWLASYETFGICSGYVLAVSLLFIFVLKITARRERYFPRYNFYLLSLLFFISITGILMKTLLRPDAVSVKYFMLGALTFHPVAAPQSKIFMTHYLASLILLVSLPPHVFTAPFTMTQARERDDALRMVLHE
jgi:nitrate reductase gamma subunit